LKKVCCIDEGKEEEERKLNETDQAYYTSNQLAEKKVNAPPVKEKTGGAFAREIKEAE
jgi:hypothetical protein